MDANEAQCKHIHVQDESHLVAQTEFGGIVVSGLASYADFLLARHALLPQLHKESLRWRL